jgi:hypothetical protein
MKEKNLFDYILESNPDDKVILTLIKYNVINKIYYYGDHFKTATPSKFVFLLKCLLTAVYILLINKRKKKSSLPIGLSSAAFENNQILSKFGFSEERLISSLKSSNRVAFDFNLFILTKRISWDFLYRDFNYLISKVFLKRVKAYVDKTEEFVKTNNYKFLFLPNDTDFFSRVYLQAFKKIDKPSFIIAHGGMPNIFDGNMDNNTDYLSMWGKMQTNSYIKMGFKPEKMFTTGHPFYKDLPKKFNFSFENILVLTKSLNGVCPLEKPHLEDRGNAIMYLYSIMNTLKKTGVSKIRFRPHPSENENWYLKFLDLNFFVVDQDSLSDSLAKSSLVIGPASTTIIDALAHEVNYLIYEPLINGKTIMGHNVNPPLDGTDDRIPIARDEEELFRILSEKRTIDISVYDELAPKYNLDFVKGILK